MFQELKALRKKIKTQIKMFEKDLLEARNSAALGGNCRGFLLHLERQVHGGKKELALLDAQMASAFAQRSTPVGDRAALRSCAPCRAPSGAKRADADAISRSRNRRRPAES